MGCVFGVGVAVGFESPPLVSEEGKKIYIRGVFYKIKTPIFSFEITPTYLGLLYEKSFYLPCWFLSHNLNLLNMKGQVF